MIIRKMEFSFKACRKRNALNGRIKRSIRRRKRNHLRRRRFVIAHGFGFKIETNKTIKKT
jgi:hypothetical protein